MDKIILCWPVQHDSITLTQEFSSEHPSVDIAYSGIVDDNLLACFDGNVVVANTDDSTTAGFVIVIYTPKYKLYAAYYHCNSVNVKVGDKVIAGQKIGTVGNTDGPGVHNTGAGHLQFMMFTKINGSWADKSTCINPIGDQFEYIFYNQLPTPAPTPVLVSKIILDAKSIKWLPGKTGTLKAAISPDNATKKTLKWMSSNTKVATITSAGKLTAIGTGTAKITCTAADGSGITAACTVTIEKPTEKPGTPDKPNQTPYTHAKGEKLTLKSVSLFTSSTTAKPTRTVTGTYWIYDGQLVNNRYRITNNVKRVGAKPISDNATGWIDAAAIK